MGTIGWSLAPLIIEVSDAGLNPFAFYIWYGLGTAFGTTLFLFFYVNIRYKTFFKSELAKIELDKIKQIFNKPGPIPEKQESVSGKGENIVKKVVNNVWHQKILLWAILGRLSIAFLALASGFVETEVATVLYEAWVIFYLIIRALNPSNSNNSDSEKLSAQDIIFFVFAAIGLLFINLSETGQFSGISIPGLVFALIGAVLAAISLERSIKWGEKAETIIQDNKEVRRDRVKTYREIRIGTVYTLVATIVMNLTVAFISAIGVFIFNWATDEEVFNFSNFFYSGFAWVFLITIILGSIEVIGYRKGGLEAQRDKIFAISYFMPIFSVIWLWIQSAISEGGVQIGRIDYFIIGISLVVAINILLNYSVDKHRLGFKWLVISFWVCGVVVLLRDQWFTMWHGFDSWLWEGSTDYYAVLGLSTTVFILVLSFRTIRINERTRHENNIVSSLYWKLWMQQSETSEHEGEVNKHRIIDKALNDLRDIDKSETVSRLDEKNVRAYFVFRKYFNNFKPADRAEVYRNFDEMVHSKSAGRDITEPLVLIAFGASTILLALVTRPQFSNWNLFVSDSFSVLFAATIAFMIFNLFDLRKERSTPILWTRTNVKPRENTEQNNKIPHDEKYQADKKYELEQWFDDLPGDWTEKSFREESEEEKENYHIDDSTDVFPREESEKKKENSRLEILFSFLLAIVIVAIFLLLLYGKWITDWNWTSMLVPDSALQNDL